MIRVLTTIVDIWTIMTMQMPTICRSLGMKTLIIVMMIAVLATTTTMPVSTVSVTIAMAASPVHTCNNDSHASRSRDRELNLISERCQ